jgi:peptidoglycan/xylan/chitin deacetylase (PgdA/CDA1 family)
MDRRGAIRAAAAIALGMASSAGCDSGAGPAVTGPTGGSGPGGSGPGGSGPGGSGPSAGASAAGPGHPAAALPAEVVSGPRDRPNVALTFHGQGDPVQVRQLLDELEQGGARVTVLAVGSWLDAQPEMARRILDGGHELGNHTQNHLAIAAMDAERAYAEINTCATRLKALTGSIGTWFRPSQTQHATPVIRAQATRAGYPTCLSYDLDSLDFTDPGAPAVVRTVLGSVRNGSIVSLHCGHAGTVAAMPELLDGLRRRGLRPVTMSELVA